MKAQWFVYVVVSIMLIGCGVDETSPQETELSRDVQSKADDAPRRAVASPFVKQKKTFKIDPKFQATKDDVELANRIFGEETSEFTFTVKGVLNQNLGEDILQGIPKTAFREPKKETRSTLRLLVNFQYAEMNEQAGKGFLEVMQEGRATYFFPDGGPGGMDLEIFRSGDQLEAMVIIGGMGVRVLYAYWGTLTPKVPNPVRRLVPDEQLLGGPCDKSSIKPVTLQVVNRDVDGGVIDASIAINGVTVLDGKFDSYHQLENGERVALGAGHSVHSFDLKMCVGSYETVVKSQKATGDWKKQITIGKRKNYLIIVLSMGEDASGNKSPGVGIGMDNESTW